MSTSGLHLVADFWGCPREPLEDEGLLRGVIKEASGRIGAHLRRLDSYKFAPRPPSHGGGVTAHAILAESHIAIHTYPEEGFVSLDIYTCGGRCNPRLGYEHIKARLRPAKISFTQMVRGA